MEDSRLSQTKTFKKAVKKNLPGVSIMSISLTRVGSHPPFHPSNGLLEVNNRLDKQSSVSQITMISLVSQIKRLIVEGAFNSLFLSVTDVLTWNHEYLH